VDPHTSKWITRRGGAATAPPPIPLVGVRRALCALDALRLEPSGSIQPQRKTTLEGAPTPTPRAIQTAAPTGIRHRNQTQSHIKRAENKAQGGKKDHRPKKGTNAVKGAERGTLVAIRAQQQRLYLVVNNLSYSVLLLPAASGLLTADCSKFLAFLALTSKSRLLVQQGADQPTPRRTESRHGAFAGFLVRCVLDCGSPLSSAEGGAFRLGVAQPGAA
jgi:hypothetical protein